MMKELFHEKRVNLVREISRIERESKFYLERSKYK